MQLKVVLGVHVTMIVGWFRSHHSLHSGINWAYSDRNGFYGQPSRFRLILPRCFPLPIRPPLGLAPSHGSTVLHSAHDCSRQVPPAAPSTMTTNGPSPNNITRARLAWPRLVWSSHVISASALRAPSLHPDPVPTPFSSYLYPASIP